MNKPKPFARHRLVQEYQGQRAFFERTELVLQTHLRTQVEATRRRHGENEFVTEHILNLEIINFDSRRLTDSLRPILLRWMRWFDEGMVGEALEDV